MNREEVIKGLEDKIYEKFPKIDYISLGLNTSCLDGDFSIEELEVIIASMKELQRLEKVEEIDNDKMVK